MEEYMYAPGFPWYVKKEDARDVLINQRKMTGIVVLALAIVNFVMEKMVVPRMSELVELVPRSNLWVSILLLVVSLIIFFQEPDFSKVDNIAKKYAKGEMIKTRLLMDWRYEWSGIISAIIMVIYLVITIILPIYNITNSI